LGVAHHAGTRGRRRLVAVPWAIAHELRSDGRLRLADASITSQPNERLISRMRPSAWSCCRQSFSSRRSPSG
jgi:hypothetical protein